MKKDLKLTEIIKTLNSLSKEIKGFKGSPHEVHEKLRKLIQSYVLQIGLELNLWDIRFPFCNSVGLIYDFTKAFYYKFEIIEEDKRRKYQPLWTIKSVSFNIKFNFKNTETLGDYCLKCRILSQTNQLRKNLVYLRDSQKQLNNAIIDVNNTINTLIKLKQ